MGPGISTKFFKRVLVVLVAVLVIIGIVLLSENGVGV